MSSTTVFAVCAAGLGISILNGRSLIGVWRWIYVVLIALAVLSGIVAANYHTGSRALAWGAIALAIFVISNAIVLSNRSGSDTGKNT